MTARITSMLVSVVGAAVVVAAGSLAPGPGAAMAATPSSAFVPVGIVRTEMHVVGFDAQAAAAHGYEIRTTLDGKQYSAKKTASATSLAATPTSVIEGNCGLSYVYEYGIGNRAAELYTGYAVYQDVIYWRWQVRLDDRGGSSYRNYLGGPNLGSWQVDQVIGGLAPGGARAMVIPGNSWALLVNGAICTAGAASSSTTITP